MQGDDQLPRKDISGKPMPALELRVEALRVVCLCTLYSGWEEVKHRQWGVQPRERKALASDEGVQKFRKPVSASV